MRLFGGIEGMYDRTSSVLVDLLVRLVDNRRSGTYTLLVSGQSSVRTYMYQGSILHHTTRQPLLDR
jgi:hypothetical protein